MSLREDEACIQELLDGSLGEPEFHLAEARMLADDDFRRLYLSYIRTHHLLAEKFDDGSGPGVEGAAARPRGRVARFAPLVLLVAVIGLAAWAALEYSQRPHGEVRVGPETKAKIVHRQSMSGDDTLWTGSRLELERGSAEIRLRGGVRGYLEGPGAVEVPEEKHALRILAGRIWLDVPASGKPFHLLTPKLRIGADAAGFGVVADPGQPEEVHAARRHVWVEPSGTRISALSLDTGESAAWNGDAFEKPLHRRQFATGFPEPVVVFADDFLDPDGTPLHGKHPRTGAGPWSVTLGEMSVRGGCLDTSTQSRNAAFAPLGPPFLDDLSPIFLLTLEAEGPGAEGWAGVSLYTGDQERIFVGDPCGPEGDWALHSVGWQAVYACPLLAGKSTVTLRYNFRNGLTELFEGSDTTGTPLASQWIAPELSFDRIRIANGSQLDAILDAGGRPEEAVGAENAHVRSRITVRNLRATVLSASHRAGSSR